MRSSFATATAALAVLMAPAARAADHGDGPRAMVDPSADITDVYAWSDASRVYLVMDVTKSATTASKFSNAVLYVLHTNSAIGLGGARTDNSINIVCSFAATQAISCWAVDKTNATLDYVSGDASDATKGVASASGRLKVFAGLRDDPFFFNLDGFKAAAAAVHGAAGSLQLDPAGCPKIDAVTSKALVSLLKSNGRNGPPVDNFGKGGVVSGNVLAIVLSVDKGLLTPDGSTISIWGSTNKVK